MNARVSTRAFVFSPLARATVIAAVWSVAAALAACEQQDQQQRTSRGDTVEAGGEVVADSTMKNPDAAWITDGNVLAMLSVFNTRQIGAANVELDSWHTDTIRQFAATVAREHIALQRSADSLAQRIKVAPVMSALSVQIDSAFRLRVDSLRGLGGSPLERAFAHEQVVAESAIADYANQLTGAAQAPEVRALAESVANDARTHLTRARTFETTLLVADSIKKAAVADSIAQAAERAAARAAARAARSARHRDTTPK
jgi:putative membrane protein